MATMLQSFRSKYPQYNDIDDDTLADGLYKKHYSDMEPDTYREMLGLKPIAPPSDPSIAERIDGHIEQKSQTNDPLASPVNLTPLAKDRPTPEPIHPDWEDTDQTGFFSNSIRLAAERGSTLLGHAISGIVGKPGEALESKAPLGQIVFGTDWGPDDPADGKFRVRYRNGKEFEQLQKQRDIENVFTSTVPDYLESADFGGEERNTPEDIKREFAERDVLGTASAVLKFGGEVGITSIPDMVAVMSGIPAISAYVAARSDEIGDTRAQNKREATGGQLNPEGFEFVERYLKPSKYPVIENEDGSVSTHRMANAEVTANEIPYPVIVTRDGQQHELAGDERLNIAYPTIVNRDGQLVQLEDEEAFNYALQTGEYQAFNTPEESLEYAKGGYKQHWGAGEGGSTFQENLEAVPFAIGSALLEKIGAGKIAASFGKTAAKEIGQEVVQAGLKQAAKQVGKRTATAAGTEAATEAFQEGVIEFLGEKVGTGAPLNWEEGLERGFFGALGGGVFGGAVGGAGAVGSEATRALDKAGQNNANRIHSASDVEPELPPGYTRSQVAPEPAAQTDPTSLLSDPRIKRDVYRYNLAGMGQNLIDEGVAPIWFNEMNETPGLSMESQQTQAAIQKALTGQPLGIREARAVEFMMDKVTGQREAPLNIDYARQQLEKSRRKRKMAKPLEQLDPLQGELFEESEYLPDMDADTRIAYELTVDLEQQGYSQQVNNILDNSENAVQAIEKLQELRREQAVTPDQAIETIEQGQAATSVESQARAATTATTGEELTTDRRLDPQRETATRRADMERRERIATMTPDQVMSELYTSMLTGLHNRRAFNEEVGDAQAIASIDVDGLSGVNDNLGHDAGDAMLKAAAEALRNTGVDAYHISGDEFYLLGDSEQEVSAAALQAQQALQEQVLEVTNGKVTGLGITTGVGTSKATADHTMESNKKIRQEQGLRSAKGQLPPGGVLYSSRPLEMAPGNNYVPIIGQVGDLPLNQDNEYMLASTGRAVQIPEQPVRRKNIMDVLQRKFGVNIFQGRVKKKKALGFYRQKFGEIRIKKKNDIEVTAHEIAHWMDEKYPWIKKLYQHPDYKKEILSVSYDIELDFEGFAEFMRLFFTQEHMAREAAPSFFDKFMKELNSRPELRNPTMEVQELMHAWYLQGARKRLQDRYGKQDISIPERVQHLINDYTDKIVQKVFDGLRPFKTIERELRGKIGSAATSGYNSLRLAYGVNGLMQALMEKGTFNWTPNGDLDFTGKGLKAIFDPVSDRMVDMQSYMVARRAAELMQQGRENHVRADEIQAGMALAGQRVEEVPRVGDDPGGIEIINDPALGGDPQLGEVFEEWLEFNERMFDFYEESGIVSAETRAAIEEMNKNYVPFNRIVESMQGEKKPGRGGKLLPRLYGGTGNINDVFESIVGNTTHMVHVALINRGKQNFYRMLKNSDTQTAGLYAAPIGTDIKGTRFDSQQVVKAVAEALGMSTQDLAMARTGLVKSPQEADLVETIDELAENLEPMVTFFQYGIDPKGDVDFYYQDGKKQFYEIADPLLWEAINHLGPKPHNMAVNILGGFANVLRRGTTITPTFQVKNFIRDTMNAFTMSKGQIVPVKAATTALVERIWTDEHYWEYMLNGGGFAAMAEADGINSDRILDSRVKIFDTLDKTLSSFEYSNRIAEFKALREKGWSKRDAALAGREISSDFALRGSSKTLRVVTISIVFLNARLQGLYRNGRELMRLEKGKAKFAGQQAYSYALRSMVSLTIPTLALYMLNKDDERYEEIPDWIRDLSWIIFTGDGEDDYVMIPKPFETGMLWGTVPERTMEAMLKDNKELGDAMLWMMMETFNLSDLPQIYKPYADLQKNKNFTGAPIIPEYMKTLEPSEQYKTYTSDAMIALGRKMNISPLKAEYLVRGYFGTWGTWALGLADFAVGDIANGGQKPTKDWEENFLLKPFVNDGPLKRTHSEDHLYKMLKETQIAANTVRSLIDRDPNRLEEYLDQPKKMAYQAMNEQLAAWAASMRELSNTMEKIKQNPDMTGEEKRAELFSLQRAKNEISREVRKANSPAAVEALIDEVKNFQPQRAANQ